MTKQPQYISFNSIINRMILNEWMNEWMNEWVWMNDNYSHSNAINHNMKIKKITNPRLYIFFYLRARLWKWYFLVRMKQILSLPTGPQGEQGNPSSALWPTAATGRNLALFGDTSPVREDSRLWRMLSFSAIFLSHITELYTDSLHSKKALCYPADEHQSPAHTHVHGPLAPR